MTDRTARGTARVAVRPPLLLLAAIGIGWVADVVWPWSVFPALLEHTLGLPLMGAALVLFVLAVRTMNRAETPIRANRPTTTIVRSGPYRASRNPIYLSFVMLHLGLALWMNSPWLLATGVVVVVVLARGVIPREEQYLTARFGDAYLEYRAAVRRWL